MTASATEIEHLRQLASTAHGARLCPRWARRIWRQSPATARSDAGHALMRAAVQRLGGAWEVSRYLTQNRRTLCAEVTRGQESLIVKIRLATDGTHDIAKEHAALSRAFSGCGAEIVPQPVSCFEDLHALVMTPLPGTTLARTLRKTPSCQTRTLSTVGERLSTFHQSTDRFEKVAAQIWHEKTIPPAIRAACRNSHDHAWADRVLDAYLTMAARTREHPVPFGFTHEDLNPQNVLIAGDRVGFIDFENSQDTHCLNDLARLALGIQIQQGLPGRRRRGDRLGLGFDQTVLDPLCDGYQLPSGHEEHFVSLLLRASLQTWLRATQNAPRRAGYRRIRRTTEQLAERLALTGA